MRFTTILAISMIALAGCTSTKPTVVVDSKPILIKIPNALLQCPQVDKRNIPNYMTLTNEEAVKYIEYVTSLLRKCGVNMDAIKKYQAQAEKLILESQKSGK